MQVKSIRLQTEDLSVIPSHRNKLRGRRRKSDPGKRKNTKFKPRVEALEARTLLAAAIFDGITLRFEVSADLDSVEVSAPAAGTLQIQVTGDQIELGAGTIGTNGFTLDSSGQTLTADLDVVGVDVVSVGLEDVVIETGDGNDEVVLQSSAVFADSATDALLVINELNRQEVASTVAQSDFITRPASRLETEDRETREDIAISSEQPRAVVPFANRDDDTVPSSLVITDQPEAESELLERDEAVDALFGDAEAIESLLSFGLSDS